MLLFKPTGPVMLLVWNETSTPWCTMGCNHLLKWSHKAPGLRAKEVRICFALLHSMHVLSSRWERLGGSGEKVGWPSGFTRVSVSVLVRSPQQFAQGYKHSAFWHSQCTPSGVFLQWMKEDEYAGRIWWRFLKSVFTCFSFCCSLPVCCAIRPDLFV